MKFSSIWYSIVYNYATTYFVHQREASSRYSCINYQMMTYMPSTEIYHLKFNEVNCYLLDVWILHARCYCSRREALCHIVLYPLQFAASKKL